MVSTKLKSIVVFSSPAGSTRRVSHVITKVLKNLGQEPMMIDIADSGERSDLQAQMKHPDGGNCLFVGSPVYACHPVPPILDLISHLPKNVGNYAIPFVTWGGVTSGIALYEMAQMLTERGYEVVGGAKILAVHSLTWQFSSPLGEGHPNTEDEHLIEEMVKTIYSKLSHGHVKSLPIQNLNYHPIEARQAMRERNIEEAKKLLPPRQLNEELCTECGVCVDACPVQAITCTPRLQIEPHCIFCCNCVRLCPEGAIKADFSQMEVWLRERAEKYGEKPSSQIFV